MDSRLHNQRQRHRLRVSRAFTPPHQQQYVQQLPPAAAAPSHFLPQQHPLQHRLSLVEDHFPHGAASAAGVPLEHCDYATLLAYRQRINGIFASHPADMVPHLARSQNIVWPQAQRPQAFQNNESRLALSDEYSRQGAFDRDYRDGREDLRSLSELDNSRRSAALSAKLFLDDVRSGYPRSAPFETAPPVDFNRHRIDGEEALAHDSLFSKSSDRRNDRSVRKRNREEVTNADSREKALRHRKFQDPGLAALPRTPESSRELSVVQRKLSSGCVVDGEDRHDRVMPPHKRQESFHVSPAKRIRKKSLHQQRKNVTGACYARARKLKSLDEPKLKLTSPSKRTEVRVQTRNFNNQLGDRNSKCHNSNPQTPAFLKSSTPMGADISVKKNKTKDTVELSINENSSMTRKSSKGTSNVGQDAVEQSPNEGLTAARPLSSNRKALRAVESTPRVKNAKTRVIRLLGSDAKVCVASRKIREGEREDNTLELQITGCQEAVQQGAGGLQKNNSKETGIEIKQEQVVLTEKCSSLLTPTTVEVPISLHMSCQNFANSRNDVMKDKECQHGRGREQIALCTSKQDKGNPCWIVSSEDSGDVNAGQSLKLPICEQLRREQEPNRPLLTLSVDIDMENREKWDAQSQQSAMISGTSLFDSLLSGNEMVIPLKSSSIEGMMLDLKETAPECEVRLFGKSLKAPVAKVSLATPLPLGTLDASLRAVPNPSLSLSQLSSDHELASASMPSREKETETDEPVSGLAPAAVESKEAVDVVLKEVEDTVLSFNHPKPQPLRQMVEGVRNGPDTISSLFNKSSEMVPVVCKLSELSAISPVLPLHISADQSPEIEATLSLHTVPSLETPSLVSAPDHQTATGLQATVNVIESLMASGTNSGQALPVESLPTKDLSIHEDRLETCLEHEDRQETISTEKQISLPKLVSANHPQARVHKLPGRAGANTWRRSVGYGSVSSQQIISKPLLDKRGQKVVSQKVPEVTAYVRKGNSLVRAPISSITGGSVSSNQSFAGVRKDMTGKGLVSNVSRPTRGLPDAKVVVKNTACSFKQVLSSPRVELQETAMKVVNCEKLSVAGGDCGSLLVVPKCTPLVISEQQQSSTFSARAKGPDESTPLVAVAEANSNELVASVQSKPQLPSGQSAPVSLNLPNSSNALYVKSKANQLIAAPVKALQVASCQTNSSIQKLYYKTNTNQLVRNGAETKKKSAGIQIPANKRHPVSQSSLKKGLRKRSSSRVWTLKDGSCSSQVKSVLPLLFPWRRPCLGLTLCAGKSRGLPKAKKGSLLFLISKRLQRMRKSQPVYSRSVGGFAIHRSGVVSLSGANLKWTKSIEKRSKQASEEATKAVAAAEKQRKKEKKAAAEVATGVMGSNAPRKMAREVSHGRGRVVTIGLARYKMDPLRRTLQRLPDQWCCDTEVRQSTKSGILSTPRRLSYDGTEYVRVGNGHKLVRDPKANARALANEKVRWSLYTARSRRAKRRQYCLFFTRFGKCSKREGDCPYIHDPEKIAVCTKFLKGNCSGTNCLFSHKVMPERMPDCSFFLEGLCTNEECPYRHVSVNPKAPICEGFLKGFCADGDECNKKHTTVCPTILATGECLDRSTCKLHHPKRKSQRAPTNNLWKARSKRQRRYFGSESISSQRSDDICFDGVSSVDDFGAEFIAVPDAIIDEEENEECERKLAFLRERMLIPQELFQGESDMLIKPFLLLQKPISA